MFKRPQRLFLIDQRPRRVYWVLLESITSSEISKADSGIAGFVLLDITCSKEIGIEGQVRGKMLTRKLACRIRRTNSGVICSATDPHTVCSATRLSHGLSWRMGGEAPRPDFKVVAIQDCKWKVRLFQACIRGIDVRSRGVELVRERERSARGAWALVGLLPRSREWRRSGDLGRRILCPYQPADVTSCTKSSATYTERVWRHVVGTAWSRWPAGEGFDDRGMTCHISGERSGNPRL